MENTTLNQAVLSTLKSDSKGFVISSTEAIAKAEAIAKVIEQFISSKLIKYLDLSHHEQHFLNQIMR